MIICGKEFSSNDISLIEDIIAENQQISRAQLSQRICEALNWRSPNGRLKDMSCRVALLKLHRQGIINLPEVHQRPCFKDKERHENKWITDIPEIWEMNEESGVLLA